MNISSKSLTTPLKCSRLHIAFRLMGIALFSSLCSDSLIAPQIDRVVPDHAEAGQTMPVAIEGAFFFKKIHRDLTRKTEFVVHDVFVARLRSQGSGTPAEYPLGDVIRESNEQLRGMVPPDTPIGSYTLIVETPQGLTAELTDAFFVLAAVSTDTGDSASEAPVATDEDTGTGSATDSETERDSATVNSTDTEMETDTDRPTDTGSEIPTDTGPEILTDTDSRTVADSETSTASDTVAGTDSETGTASDSDTNSDSGADTGTASGEDSDSLTAADTDTGTGSDTVLDTETIPDTDTTSVGGDTETEQTCDDGVHNHDEKGVDCGGAVCPPCTTCTLSAPERITGLGVTGGVYGPSLTADGHTMYFTGVRSSGDIFVATRDDRGTVFSPAEALPYFNTGNDEGTPYISYDGLSLYYSVVNALAGTDLMVATRASVDDDFREGVPLDELNTSLDDHLPRLSPDELTIYFSSDRGQFWTGQEQDGDIWMATRDATAEPFGTPQFLGGINSGEYEGASAITDDGLTLYFTSSRTGGVGNDDLWVATRTTATSQFRNVQNMGTPINSNVEEWDVVLTFDESELFFVSFRYSLYSQIWRVSRECYP